jgi:hypothetical protein
MEKGNEKDDSLPISVIDDLDVEREVISTDDSIRNGDLPLMDLDKGLVGWDSQDDPMNPTLEIRSMFASQIADIKFLGTGRHPKRAST